MRTGSHACVCRKDISGGVIPVTPAAITALSMQTMQTLRKSIEEALVGRTVRVISNHNGQVIGRSRKSWRGEVCKISDVHIDLYNGISLRLEGHEYEYFIPADEVEFV